MAEPASRKTGKHMVELRNVSRWYHMGHVRVKALSRVTVDIARGEFVVILGPSGSGKTTLLNLIGGLDSPTSGTIRVGGVPITALDEGGLTHYRRERIGFVFQFFNLVPTLTAGENVEFAADLVAHPRDTLRMLRVVGLRRRANHYPSELSGGEDSGGTAPHQQNEAQDGAAGDTQLRHRRYGRPGYPSAQWRDR